jgi:uncharacterized protein with GYD domain
MEERIMAKYLFIGSYTAQGAKGVLEKGGTAREQAAREAVESVGGTMEAFYFGFGSDDAYVLIDAPSQAAASAVSLAVSAGGGFAGRIVVLITPEEIDQAAKMTPSYRPPGS